MALGKEILERRILKTERVFVPEWDGEAIVRQLTGAEVKNLQPLALESVDTKKNMQIRNADALNRFRIQIVALCWVNEDGTQVTDDVALLESQSFSAIERIADAAARLNGLMGDAVGTATKN